jgi:hypothetical protein
LPLPVRNENSLLAFLGRLVDQQLLAIADEHLPVGLGVVPAHHSGLLEHDLPSGAIVAIVESGIASLLKLGLQGLGLVVKRLNQTEDHRRIERLTFLGRATAAKRKQSKTQPYRPNSRGHQPVQRSQGLSIHREGRYTRQPQFPPTWD